MEIEIYFRDLSEEKQAELLKAYGVKSPEEMNWDVFPVAVIVKEDYVLTEQEDDGDG